MTSNHPIDALFEIRARIAELEAAEKALRDEIIAFGVGVHRGSKYDAMVSTSERGNLDLKAVRAALSAEFIAANTKTSTITTVKVVARAA